MTPLPGWQKGHQACKTYYRNNSQKITSGDWPKLNFRKSGQLNEIVWMCVCGMGLLFITN